MVRRTVVGMPGKKVFRMTTFDECFGPTRILCMMTGMWPLGENASLGIRLLARLMQILSMMGYGNFIIPEISMIVAAGAELSATTRVGCVLTVVLLLASKQLYLIFYSAEIGRFYFRLKDLWIAADFSPKGRKIYDGFAHNTRLLSIVFFFTAFGNNILFTVAAVANWRRYNRGEEPGVERHLPVEATYEFDVTSTPNYEIAFVLQKFSAFFCCVGFAGLDSLILTLVLHVCAQFAILKSWYKGMGNKKYRKEGKVTVSKDVRFFQRKICRCVEHHKKIINLAEQMESLFGPVAFGQYVLSALGLCFCGYAIATGIGKKIDATRFTNFFLVCIAELSAFCLAGEILMTESMSVGDAVFHEVSWYNFPIILQRDLQLTIVRSQKCCCLTAAGFSIMNMELLSNIISSAASYFTLLRQMKSGEND